MDSPSHTPFTQKITDQRWLIGNSTKIGTFFISNDVIKGYLVWINIVFLFNLIRSDKL